MQGRNFFAGNCETGQLTDRGWLQLRGLGEMYRTVYGEQYGLIGNSFDPSSQYFRTDADDRNVASMDGLLAGLFPANTTAGSANWAAWNIDTMDSAYDDISPNPKLCPIFKSYTQNFTETTAYQAHEEEYSVRLYEQIFEAIGVPIDGV
jgi:hypothetical protein